MSSLTIPLTSATLIAEPLARLNSGVEASSWAGTGSAATMAS